MKYFSFIYTDGFASPVLSGGSSQMKWCLKWILWKIKNGRIEFPPTDTTVARVAHNPHFTQLIFQSA